MPPPQDPIRVSTPRREGSLLDRLPLDSPEIRAAEVPMSEVTLEHRWIRTVVGTASEARANLDVHDRRCREFLAEWARRIDETFLLGFRMDDIQPEAGSDPSRRAVIFGERLRPPNPNAIAEAVSEDHTHRIEGPLAVERELPRKERYGDWLERTTKLIAEQHRRHQ